jgi:DNA-binding NtrC family response regulator
VRELKNVVERVVIRAEGRPITPEDLPEEITARNAFTQVSVAFDTDAPQPITKPQAELFWERMVVKGESFWTVVYPAFIDRELTKTDLRKIIRAGLQHTQGSYRKLVELFRMSPGDYKRFLAFLYQHDCHLPFHGFREPRPEERPIARGA